jgi:uncharacterized protein YecT (DUF1311 family)
MCWSKKSNAAAEELQTVYAQAKEAARGSRAVAAALAAGQAAWVEARDKTCAFEYELYLPGTIAPQISVECDVRMTRARAQRLRALLPRVQKKEATRVERPVSAAADVELNRVYRIYLERIMQSQRSALAAAELAWISYRDKACGIEGGSCLTELERERTLELEAAWIGEAFW